MDKFKVRDQRRKGFFITDNDVIDKMAKEIGVFALAVYFTLVRHSDKSQESFPSQETIAEKLGISRDTISEKIKVLEAHNMISVTQTREEGTGIFLHNIYTLLDRTVWRETDMDPCRSKPVRVEANTVPPETDTNNTHDLKKPIEKNFNQEKLDRLKAEMLIRKERKAKKMPFGTGSKPNNSAQNFDRPKKGVVHAEDVL